MTGFRLTSQTSLLFLFTFFLCAGIIQDTMASIPEEAKQVTFSVIDELTSEIVENVTKRLGNWMALQVRLRLPPLRTGVRNSGF